MSFFTDVFEWGMETLDTAYDYAEDAYDYLLAPTVEHPLYGTSGGVLTQAWDWTTETAGDVWDWAQGSSTSAGIARDLTKEVAGSFLQTDSMGRPINLPDFKRSQARTNIPGKAGQPSLYDMGYTPRAMQRAQQARNSSNQYVQGGLRLISENIALGSQTITLSSAEMSKNRIARKYVG